MRPNSTFKTFFVIMLKERTFATTTNDANEDESCVCGTTSEIDGQCDPMRRERGGPSCVMAMICSSGRRYTDVAQEEHGTFDVNLLHHVETLCE